MPDDDAPAAPPAGSDEAAPKVTAAAPGTLKPTAAEPVAAAPDPEPESTEEIEEARQAAADAEAERDAALARAEALERELAAARAPAGETQVLPEWWTNETRGSVGILRVDATAKGGTIVEQIPSGRTFNITADERRLTERKITNPAHNPFRNGAFSPKEIPATSAVDEFTSSPNLISHDEIVELLNTQNVGRFQEKVEAVDSPITLKRMLQVADDQGAAQLRLKILRDRLEEIGDNEILGDPSEPTFSGKAPDKREKYYEDSDRRPTGDGTTVGV